MPVVRKIMKSLVKQYGKKKAKKVYYGMETEGKLKKAMGTMARRRAGK